MMKENEKNKMKRKKKRINLLYKIVLYTFQISFFFRKAYK